MMAYGVKTWDANGVDNNTGIVKVFVVGQYKVSSGQQSGSATFNVPIHAYLDFYFQPTGSVVVSSRRRVTISGGTISLSPVASDDFSTGTYNAGEGTYLIYARGLQ